MDNDKLVPDKPVMKRLAGVDEGGSNVLCFWAHEAIARKMSEFGVLEKTDYEGKWRLIVDCRFDYGEVRAYVHNYTE